MIDRFEGQLPAALAFCFERLYRAKHRQGRGTLEVGEKDCEILVSGFEYALRDGCSIDGRREWSCGHTRVESPSFIT